RGAAATVAAPARSTRPGRPPREWGMAGAAPIWEAGWQAVRETGFGGRYVASPLGYGSDAAAHAALRTSSVTRRAHGAVRRVGDARAIRRRHSRAQGGPCRLRGVRRLAHGRAGGRGDVRPRAAPVAPVQ